MKLIKNPDKTFTHFGGRIAREALAQVEERCEFLEDL